VTRVVAPLVFSDMRVLLSLSNPVGAHRRYACARVDRFYRAHCHTNSR
jgi:hypothetical protein